VRFFFRRNTLRRRGVFLDTGTMRVGGDGQFKAKLVEDSDFTIEV
jgi:hypothetical protein